MILSAIAATSPASVAIPSESQDSPCPIKVLQQVIDEMNMQEITISYGQTEGPGLHPDDDRRFGGVAGQYRRAGSPLYRGEPETGEKVPHGVQGEFCAREFNVMKGYYKMEEAT